MAASVMLAETVYDVSCNVILDSAMRAITAWDVVTSMIKCWVFGTIISAGGCWLFHSWLSLVLAVGAVLWRLLSALLLTDLCCSEGGKVDPRQAHTAGVFACSASRGCTPSCSSDYCTAAPPAAPACSHCQLLPPMQ